MRAVVALCGSHVVVLVVVVLIVVVVVVVAIVKLYMYINIAGAVFGVVVFRCSCLCCWFIHVCSMLL